MFLHYALISQGHVYKLKYACKQVLESVVKNCGQTIHDEVASKQTMEELKELFKVFPAKLNLYSVTVALRVVIGPAFMIFQSGSDPVTHAALYFLIESCVTCLFG